MARPRKDISKSEKMNDNQDSGIEVDDYFIMDNELLDIDIFDFTNSHNIPEQNEKVNMRVKKTHDKHLFRRFNSERALESALDWDFQPNCSYHILSGGDVDSLSFLKFILRQQPLFYCLLSTWCMAKPDIDELERYLLFKRIEHLDCYVGEIFKGSYYTEWLKLCEVLQRYGGRVCMFRNHSKVIVGFGKKFDFVIESSANINTNPRTENTVITLNKDLAEAYKSFFDGIVSFERNFDNWSPILLPCTV